MPENKPRRCAWVKGDLMERYHDTEWGVPTRDEGRLYEMFLLEAFQAGLSWYVVLRKRENFRNAFDGFNPEKIALYDEKKIEALLKDEGIIRCRRKIEGAVGNAKHYLEILREFGTFAAYIDSFTGGQTIVNTTGEVICRSDLSDRMAKDLKKRGMRYMGSVTLYSFLQAVGVVDDHEPGCEWRGR